MTYLLELSLSCEAVQPVLGAGSPSYGIVGIKFYSGSPVFLRDKLQPVIVDEHIS